MLLTWPRFRASVGGELQHRSKEPLRSSPFLTGALLALLVIARVAAAQGVSSRDAPPQQKPGAARVAGYVLAADTGKPLPGAIVHIAGMRAANPTERQGRWVTTDVNGRWELRDVAAGRYTVTASKGGYLRVQYGQQRPFEPGKTIEVGDGQSFDKIDVALPRGGAITGRVVDQFGEPVTSAFVSALRYRYVDGQRQLTPLTEGIESLSDHGGLTDDLGQYRLFGLSPGEYFVSALFSPPGESASRSGFPLSYHPGTASPGEAQRVSVRLGQEAQNVNIALVSARYAQVSGTVLSSAGSPVKASITLTSTALVAAPVGGSGVASADGTFTKSNVAPGEYRLHAWHSDGSGAQEFATLPLTIAGQDIAGLTLVTAPVATARGRIVFDGDARPDARLWVRAVATAPGAPSFANTSVGVRPDLTFEVRGLGGRQTFRPGNLSDGWFLEAITHEGVDITDSGYEFKPGQTVSGIDIHLTQRATTLTGTVSDDRDRALTDFTVVAFSTDSGRWRFPGRFVRSVRPNQDGQFSMRGLPPDDYLVVALEYVEAGQEADPEQLDRWRPLGTKISLARGESKAIKLTLLR